MTLKLAQLEAFYAVIKAGSISEAARQLHLTQPALSLQIRELEEYFQAQLLERTNKGIKPTAAGELVYNYSQKLMGMKEALNSEIKKLQNEATPVLRVGAATVVGGYALPCSIYAFKEKHPYAELRLTVAPSRVILEALLEGGLDVAVVEGPLFEPQGTVAEKLLARSIGHDELVLVAAPELIPAEKSALTLEELRRLPLIVREKGSAIRLSLEQALAGCELSLTDLNVVMELNSLDAIKASVGAGKGFALLSYLSVRKELYYRTLRSLPVEGLSLESTFTLVHPKRIFSSLLEKTFIDFMRSKNRSFC
jgi:DNA-binding transcriptional LysR family regulator